MTNHVKRVLMGLGSVSLVLVLVMLVAPGTAHAVVATLVQVVNTTTNPAIVSNIDDRGRIPYQAQIYGTSNTNCPAEGSCAFTFDAVPAGHRLVVQHVSMEIQAAANSVPALVSLGASLGSAVTVFPATVQVAGDVPTIAFDQPVLAYFNAGQTPVAGILLGNGNFVFGGSTSQNASLSGYLLDCTAAPCSAIAH